MFYWYFLIVLVISNCSIEQNKSKKTLWFWSQHFKISFCCKGENAQLFFPLLIFKKVKKKRMFDAANYQQENAACSQSQGFRYLLLSKHVWHLLLHTVSF